MPHLIPDEVSINMVPTRELFFVGGVNYDLIATLRVLHESDLTEFAWCECLRVINALRYFQEPGGLMPDLEFDNLVLEVDEWFSRWGVPAGDVISDPRSVIDVHHVQGVEAVMEDFGDDISEIGDMDVGSVMEDEFFMDDEEANMIWDEIAARILIEHGVDIDTDLYSQP